MTENRAPRLSVVMCVQNGIPYLETAAQSILAQTFTDFEFIIVDDHSTDGTLAYLQNLKDPRVRVLQAEKRGQTPGLNQGLRVAKANWIARMDGDDWSAPHRFERQWNAAQSPGVVLISADYWVCDEEFKESFAISLSSKANDLTDYLRRKNNPFCHPVMMFHREAALSVGGFDESLQNAQDYRLWLRILEKGSLVHVGEPLLRYRVRRGSLSILRQPEQTSERRRILSGSQASDHTLTTTHASSRAVQGLYEYRLAFAAWCAGQTGPSRFHAIQAVRYSTRLLRSFMLLLFSFFPARWSLQITGYSRVFRIPTTA